MQHPFYVQDIILNMLTIVFFIPHNNFMRSHFRDEKRQAQRAQIEPKSLKCIVLWLLKAYVQGCCTYELTVNMPKTSASFSQTKILHRSGENGQETPPVTEVLLPFDSYQERESQFSLMMCLHPGRSTTLQGSPHFQDQLGNTKWIQ